MDLVPDAGEADADPDGDLIPGPSRIDPKTTADLIDEAEHQLGTVVSVARESLRRIRLHMHEHPNAMLESAGARSLRELSMIFMDLLKWHYPRGKPEDHDRPLGEIMDDLLAQPGARAIARRLLAKGDDT